LSTVHGWDVRALDSREAVQGLMWKWRKGHRRDVPPKQVSILQAGHVISIKLGIDSMYIYLIVTFMP
jgi:hypothetical protein